MQKIEYQIGERLTVNDPELGNVTLEVVEDKDIITCVGCFFFQSCMHELDGRYCHRCVYDIGEGNCSFACRSDRRNIRYLRVKE